MNNPSPRFTGLFIPVEILEKADLTLLEQMLLSWIDALFCEDHGGCYAKNDYFAKRLKVKENTIAKALTSLRQKDLVEDVSFDGRNRVIRAKIGQYVEKIQRKSDKSKSESNPALDLNPTLGWTEIQPCIGFLSKPSYIESKEEDKEENNTSLKVPEEPSADADLFAVANDVILDNPPIQASLSEKPTKEKSQSDFSPQVKEVAQKMSSILKEANPDWIIPKNPISMMSQVKLLIEKDNRTPERILEVFRWTAADHFWMKNLSKPNPAKYLRDHFAQLAACADAKPPKKERRFAASSNDKIALEGMKNMETI